MKNSGPVCRPVSMSLNRLFGRLWVIGGGVFWVTAAFGAEYGYRNSSMLVSARNALLPLALTLIVLGVGWFYEYIAAGLLATASLGIVAWGLIAGWETGVWALMFTTLLLPMAVAGTLFFLAARMQRICSLAPAESVA